MVISFTSVLNVKYPIEVLISTLGFAFFIIKDVTLVSPLLRYFALVYC